MRRVFRAVRLAAAFFVVTLIASGAMVFSRSDVVDESVRRIAAPLAPIIPKGHLGPFAPAPAGVEYPVIERVVLLGHVDVLSGAAVSPGRIWWRETASPERVVPLLLLLLIAGAAFAVLSIRWCWPPAWPGERFMPGRLAWFAGELAVWSSPLAILCLFLFWPIVSFWGTVSFLAVDVHGAYAWVSDNAATRVLVGAGLTLTFSLGTLAIARCLLNTFIHRGALDGVLQVASSTTACLECGYFSESSERCPECGHACVPTRRARFIWPSIRVAPTRARRRFTLVALAALVLGFLGAPLIAGIGGVLLHAL